MATNKRTTKAMLLANAVEVANRLRVYRDDTNLKIRIPKTVYESNTDGWSVDIGNLGSGQPKLTIWLDKFSGYSERKFYAGFYSRKSEQIESIIDSVAEKFGVVRETTSDEILDDGPITLAERLQRSEFNAPLHDHYDNGMNFFGFYDPSRFTSSLINKHFCTRAVTFFEDVARSLPDAKQRQSDYDQYPRVENRKIVRSHIARERSGYLALERKSKDGFICQICGFNFERTYGDLGVEFAEAHHKVPLSMLDKEVRTTLDDLITVCANCHRMLHRMEGSKGDIPKLKNIVRKHKTSNGARI